MHLLLLILLAALTLAVGAEPALSSYRVHEHRAHVPLHWTRTRRLDPASVIPLRFALKQRNVENIRDFLHAVSHPRSPNYGKHWTAGDVALAFAPTDETIDVVRRWLISSGIEEDRIALGRTKGWVEVNVTIEEAEQLVLAEYNVYTHVSGKEHVACEVYHLPEHVQRHVDFVTPSVHFDAKLSRRSTDHVGTTFRNIGQPGVSTTSPKIAGTVSEVAGELEQCDEYITPACLRALYGLFYHPASADKNSIGIVEYSPQAHLESDLQIFARNYSVDLIGKAPYMVSIDGGYVQTVNQSEDYDGESSLDLQYSMSLVTGKQTVTLYQTGDMIEGASFNNFLDAIDGSYCSFEGGDDPNSDGVYPDEFPGGYTGPEACGTVKPTNVISTSYAYDEGALTPFYAQRQCDEYAKLGLMGVTVLFSSGDYGVAGNRNYCLSTNGSETTNGPVFNPGFPSTCPYVTSVGATMVKPNATVFEPEVACNELIYSGGGFSNYFSMPDYQKDAVHQYLENHRPHYPSYVWNSTGTSRAFPDISANGANYVVIIQGNFTIAFGTSASAPVSAAIFTMINDARLTHGKSPIGFVNPVIYSSEFADAFNDITEGNNPGCGTSGFEAAKGWDPVTGLGTPHFAKLVRLWLKLP